MVYGILEVIEINVTITLSLCIVLNYNVVMKDWCISYLNIYCQKIYFDKSISH